MGKRVFNTEFAPSEEVDGVKAKLDEAGIRYYEIKNSRLWLGGGSICVSDPEDYERARRVIEEFQNTWRERARRDPVPKRMQWKPMVILVIIFGLFVFVTIKSLGG